MIRKVIKTNNAPQAIGTYSQAVRAGSTVYMAGQIGLDPKTGVLVEGIEAQIRRVFSNLKAVAEASGGSLSDAVKLNIYLTDLAHFAKVNQIMGTYFSQPYPARAAVGVAALPKGAAVEMDAIMVLEKKPSPHNFAWSKIGRASARPVGGRAKDGAQQRRKGRKEKRLRVKTKKSS